MRMAKRRVGFEKCLIPWEELNKIAINKQHLDLIPQ